MRTRYKAVIGLLLLILALGGCLGRPLQAGSLLVETPRKYQVKVDEQIAGTTGQVLPNLPLGKHQVSLVDKGKVIWTGQAVITSGKTTTLTPALPTDPVPNPAPEPSPPPQPEPEPQPGPEPQPEPKPIPAPPDDKPTDAAAYQASLTADFAARDALPETTVPQSRWDSYGKYGPPAAQYPAPTIPAQYNKLQWQRDRVVAVAKKYIGKVPYAHKHIPSLGLDCSNFTAWVYNYGLGIKFTSSVGKQGETVGRKLGKTEPLLPGDLLFFQDSTGKITHAAIYIEPGYMIDESGNVAIKRFPSGWNATAFAHARRVLE